MHLKVKTDQAPLVQRGVCFAQQNSGDCLHTLPICNSFKMTAIQSLSRFATAPFAQGSLFGWDVIGAPMEPRSGSSHGSLFLSFLLRDNFLCTREPFYI